MAAASSFDDQLQQHLNAFAVESFVDAAKQQGSRVPALQLNFNDCTIQLSDTERLECVLDEISRKYFNYRHDLHIDLSLAACRFGCHKVVVALEMISAKFQVRHLDFSETQVHFPDQLRLVSTCGSLGLTSLRLSLRYQPGVIAPLVEQCSEHLLELTLDAKAPFEHRVRRVAMVELAPALVSLKKLQRFALIDCELEDEVFALLTGSLLALKDTLKRVHLQAEGGNGRGLSWESLLLLAHYATEFPLLETLLLDIKDCSRLLGLAPAETRKGFLGALQNCQPGLDLFLVWHNVGWTQEMAGRMLQALAKLDRHESTLSVDIQDFDFLQDSHQFAKDDMATLLSLQKDALLKLSVVDLHSSSSSADFQSDGTRASLLDSIQQSKSLETFTFQVGPKNRLCEEDEEIGPMLRRNAEKNQHQKDLPNGTQDDTEILWPQQESDSKLSGSVCWAAHQQTLKESLPIDAI